MDVLLVADPEKPGLLHYTYPVAEPDLNTGQCRRLKIAAIRPTDTVVVSLPGYKPYRLLLASPEVNKAEVLVRLQVAATTLQEVMVRPVDPHELIRQAIRRVGRFWHGPGCTDCFYQGKLFVDQSSLALIQAEHQLPGRGLQLTNASLGMNRLPIRIMKRTYLVSYQPEAER